MVAAEVLDDAKREQLARQRAERKALAEKIFSEIVSNLVESVQAREVKAVATEVYRYCYESSCLLLFTLCILWVDNSKWVIQCAQGIIDSTGTVTFAKEPKLAKLLRELKFTPVSYNKKVRWFFSHVCKGEFAVF